jgi:hypothetical protein
VQAPWALKGYPEDMALLFVSHCATRELSKSLKKIVDQLYLLCSVREAAVRVDTVKKFLALLLEELIRPKDVEFKKIQLLLYYVHTACRRLYPNSSEFDVLKFGVINLLFRFLQKTLEDPYSGTFALF